MRRAFAAHENRAYITVFQAPCRLPPNATRKLPQIVRLHRDRGLLEIHPVEMDAGRLRLDLKDEQARRAQEISPKGGAGDELRIGRLDGLEGLRDRRPQQARRTGIKGKYKLVGERKGGLPLHDGRVYARAEVLAVYATAALKARLECLCYGPVRRIGRGSSDRDRCYAPDR